MQFIIQITRKKIDETIIGNTFKETVNEVIDYCQSLDLDWINIESAGASLDGENIFQKWDKKSLLNLQNQIEKDLKELKQEIAYEKANQQSLVDDYYSNLI